MAWGDAKASIGEDSTGGADYTVLTPERVSVQYTNGGPGSRGAALLVDTALQWLLAIVVGLGVLGLALAFGTQFEQIATGQNESIVVLIALALLIVALFLIFNGYFILFEIIWSGQTPGKRLLHLRVVRENGYPIRPADAVIRNLVRIVDALPTLYLVGIITMFLNSRSRRLGDIAAGTIVVHEPRERALLGLAANATSASGPVVLQPRDATLVRDFLLRRGAMRPASRRALASRLAESLATTYHLEAARKDARDDEVFLEQI